MLDAPLGKTTDGVQSALFLLFPVYLLKGIHLKKKILFTQLIWSLTQECIAGIEYKIIRMKKIYSTILICNFLEGCYSSAVLRTWWLGRKPAAGEVREEGWWPLLVWVVKCKVVIRCQDGCGVSIHAELGPIPGPGKLNGTERLEPVAKVAAAAADGAAAITVFRSNFIFLLKMYLSINIEIMLDNVREEEERRENSGPYNKFILFISSLLAGRDEEEQEQEEAAEEEEIRIHYFPGGRRQREEFSSPLRPYQHKQAAKKRVCYTPPLSEDQASLPSRGTLLGEELMHFVYPAGAPLALGTFTTPLLPSITRFCSSSS